MYYYDRDLNGNQEHEGVFLHVPARHGHGLPRWRWHARRAEQHDVIMSLMVGDVPALWIRIDSWWDDMLVLKASPGAPSTSPLPPMSSKLMARVVRESERFAHLDDPLGESWLRQLAILFGESLRYEALWQGRWLLSPAREYTRRMQDITPEQQDLLIRELMAPCYEVFNRVTLFPWPLRQVQYLDGARLQWWRKVARQDHLPPIICMRVEPLLTDVILDGHERLLAALLEGVAPAFMRLNYFSERVMEPDIARAEQERIETEYGYMHGHNLSPQTIERLNMRARYAYSDATFTSSMRAWPMHEGVSEWTRQVRERAARLMPEFDELVAQMVYEAPEPIVEELMYRRDDTEE